eukprot:scaffold432228_cov47-Prasinocladus_malaysianus.AAC.1
MDATPAKMANKARRKPNILLIGSGLMRQLYETIVCGNEADLVHEWKDELNDDFRGHVFHDMELVYGYGDYSVELLAPFVHDHQFGEGRTAKTYNQQFDVIITDKSMDYINAITP